MKKWIIPDCPISGDNEVVREFGELMGGVLVRRGITTLDKAREFFSCGKLSDPFLMSDMKSIVEVIQKALDEDKKIVIFGDYDCDGTAATAMLYSYLEAQGADVDFYIPNRTTEGYGMKVEALKKLAERGAELIITVDNGVCAVEEAKFLKETGIGLVITDHHQPGETLPECDACVDPHRADDMSPFKDLCGAGVVLKLLIALEGDDDLILDRYADLAAVATIADVMPLKGENRFIVQRGLESIRAGQNAGLSQLIKLAGRNISEITSMDLAFYVCPRINAAGRMSTADKAVRLMLCEDDVETARRIAEELNALNSKRRDEEEKIMSDVRGMIENDPMILKRRVIVMAGEGWSPGMVGLAAGKLVEKYGKPTLLMAVNNGKAGGSMRSVEGFPAHTMLDACGSVLTTHGGHPGAGGCSLEADKVDEFIGLIQEYAKKNYPKMPSSGLALDGELSFGDLGLDSVKKLMQLEPFGEGNREPMFLFRGCRIRSKTALSGGKFTSLTLENDGITIRAVTFDVPFARFYPGVGEKIDIAARAEPDRYNNDQSVQLKIEDYRPEGFSEDRFFAAQRVYEEICRGEGCDKRLAPRVVPQSREELMKIYDLIRKSGGAKTPEELAMFGNGVNFCMLSITLDAFKEAGMIEYENGCPKVVPVNQKTDLFKQGLIARLNKEFLQ